MIPQSAPGLAWLTAVFCGMAVAPGMAFASDCPDLGMSGASEEQFCGEFRDLLYAPFEPGSNRDAVQPDEDLNRILESDSLWGEVYRADPKKTLALIGRIRDAGGLTED